MFFNMTERAKSDPATLHSLVVDMKVDKSQSCPTFLAIFVDKLARCDQPQENQITGGWQPRIMYLSPATYLHLANLIAVICGCRS